jgi:predicted RNase H-like HicB family nuclease
MATRREFDVILEEQDEGGFVASVPDLPGVWTQGETREETVAMVKEAIAGYLDTLEELGRPLPKPNREHLTVRA